MKASVRKQYIPCEIHYGTDSSMGSTPVPHLSVRCVGSRLSLHTSVRPMGSKPAVQPSGSLWVRSMRSAATLHSCQNCGINTIPAPLLQIYGVKTIPPRLSQIQGINTIHVTLYKIYGVSTSPSPLSQIYGVSSIPVPICQICEVNTNPSLSITCVGSTPTLTPQLDVWDQHYSCTPLSDL